LSEAQSKKKAIYIEGLAIREAVRYWRFWLIGRRFTVITDHKPLQYLNLKARTDEELGDLAHELLQFDFEVLYRPGSSNSEADCLSRNPVLNAPSDHVSLDPIIPSFNFLSLSEIRSFQSNIVKLDTDIIKENVIFRKIRNNFRIVIDKVSGKKLVSDVHFHFGHVGSKHLIAILCKHFYFPDMTVIIRKFCAACITCIKNKSRCNRRSGKLGFLGPASSPYEIMSLDTIGGFGGNKSPKRYLHLLVDHFSRYAFILCTKGQTAREMISLVDSVHKRHPIGTLMTDQYGGLSSDEFCSYCSSSGITHVFAAVDSAFSNGLNERLNQTLVNRIRCVKHDETTPFNKSWTSIAEQCVIQYNDSPHSVTKFSPSYLLNGLSNDIIPDSLTSPPNIAIDRKIAFSNTLRQHEYNKKNYDKNKNDVTFKVGDFVFIDNGSKLNRDKLDNLRIGPYCISKQLCNNVFEVDVGRGPFFKRLYHASKMLSTHTFVQ
jgi:transposase InsO family protein